MMNESGKGSTLRAVLLWGVPLAAVAVGLAVWALGGRYVETDNAYVKADLVPLYPEIEAQVTEVLVAENARVEAGQVLLKLDPESAEIDERRAEARLVAVREQLAAARKQLEQRNDERALAEEQIRTAQVATRADRRARERSGREIARARGDGKTRGESADARALGKSLDRSQFQRNAAGIAAFGSAGIHPYRQLSRCRVAWPHRHHLTGERRRVRDAAAAKRVGQLGEGGAARAGAYRHRRRPAGLAATCRHECGGRGRSQRRQSIHAARRSTLMVEVASMTEAASARSQRTLLSLSTMLAVLLYAIDTTVANVALPVMQGSLAATREQVAWVLTSYLIASAVALPALGAIEARLGLRRSFMLAVAGFGVSSVLCGLAPNIETLVIARFMQGLCGAGLLPLSQTAMQAAYPPGQQARVFALFGMGVMVGPVVGPWLGGWLTENFGWRSVFYINMPVVALSLAGLLSTLRGPPQSNPRSFDRFGFALLATCILTLQLAVDRGQQLDWFDSPEIVIEVAVGVLAAYMFVVHSRTGRRTLFPGALLRDRNLVLGVAMSVLVGWPFMGAMVLLPQFLQEVQGYSVVDAGILMAPRGLGLIVSMLALSRIGPLIDLRMAFSLGCVLNTVGLLAFAWLPADVPANVLTGWLLLQGVGLGLIFVPLNTLTFTTLAPIHRTDGAALMVLARNLGSSIGVAMLVRGISIDAAANADRLREIAHGVVAEDPGSIGLALRLVYREALVIAYSNQYLILSLMPAVLLPCVWLMQRSAVSGKSRADAGQAAPPDAVPH
ncbi:MAG: DHA2 family efflux MFS transporter permease subunit [Gammaproteobacteria bacterium]|nr:DHA2 family efflux MFS transporter permease subunit [Gammaproteobacteria bacterium]